MFLSKIFLRKYLLSETMTCVFECEYFAFIYSGRSLWLGPLEFSLATGNRRDPGIQGNGFQAFT